MTLGSISKPIEVLRQGTDVVRALLTHHESSPGKTIHLVSRGPAAHAWADELAQLDNRHAVRVDIVLDRDAARGTPGAVAPLAAVTALAQRAIAVRLVLTARQVYRAARHVSVLESLVRDAAARGARDVVVAPSTSSVWRPWSWHLWSMRPSWRPWRGLAKRTSQSPEAVLELLRLRHGLPRTAAGRG